MRDFSGNMFDYIFEEKEVGMHVLSERQIITQSFVEILKANDIHRVIFTGAGTSNYSPQSARILFERFTGAHTYVVLPTQLINEEYKIDKWTLVCGISATGTSKNTIDALRKSKSQGALTVAFTHEPESHFAKENDAMVLLDYGEENCSPKSKSYLVEMLTITLCSLEYGHEVGNIDNEEYLDHIRRIEATLTNLYNLADKSHNWFKIHENEFNDCQRLMVIGYRGNYGNIQEGALKILECGRFQTAFYELEEFMHGIYHSIKSDTYVVFVLNGHIEDQRALKLRDYLARFTDHLFVICKDQFKDERSLNLDYVNDPDYYYLENIVPLQILSYDIANARGINPNVPSDPNFHQIMSSKETV